ncbi:MAG TPA: hypothetical protein VNN15_05805, partial [Solirubrobacterales bacterium]|nr:hypothetical protein [Solirubrobacterales bacterium]
MPGVFSSPSAPMYAMRVPAEVPALTPDRVQATMLPGDVGGTFRIGISLSGGPTTHESAIDCYRLRIWLHRSGSPIEPLVGGEAAPCVQGGLEWSSEPILFLGPGQIDVLVAYVDPLGRQGPVLKLEPQ